MTASNNGTPDPGNDDPFAYLYRQEGADPGETAAATGAPAANQPGVPRTNFNQVQRVGERRQAPAYGYPPQQQGQQPPPQPSYATQQLPPQQNHSGGYGGGHASSSGGGHGGGSQGPNSKGLLIGAVAVVAAVSIGIGVAMASGDETATGASVSPSASAGASGGSNGSSDPSASASSSADSGAELSSPTDAATLQLAGGATVASDVSGADATDGKYVAGMEAVGASATWTFDAPKKGQYSLHVSYSVPGTDATSTVTVNGEGESRALNMKNYSNAASGDYEKGWTNTWSVISVKKGSNTVSISCGAGNTCSFYLDQVWLVEGTNG